MKLTLGFSPCPNDTFIFDAMVHGRIDTEGLTFEYRMADVEELNRSAMRCEPDIVKLSYHAYAYVANDYLILDAGSALGYRSGPLLVGRKKLSRDELLKAAIAIPGRHTTANLLFSIAWPEVTNKREFLFSDIEDAILSGEADAGLIIHENRFTYYHKGLVKIADMGEYWETLTRLPVPLGAIAVKRSIDEIIAMKIDRIINRSIMYARTDSLASFWFVKNNARNMDCDVINNHIRLYVNDFTINIGQEGKEAVKSLYRIATERGVIEALPHRIFLSEE
jgi:1,4-dihydroxy-6-naphthoate synthase